MKIRFLSISSGSCGNCYYLGTPQYGFLIDAGISARSIRLALRNVGIPIEKIYAVFVTHDHADHIKSLQTLAEKASIPIYATRQVHQGIERSYCVQGSLPTGCVRYVEKEQTLQFRDFAITPFEVPHDSTDNVGYHIVAEERHFCIATDIGYITDTITRHLTQANYLMIESNYEEAMLQMGRYPRYLKERITGPHGHLSNREAADFVATHYSERLKNIWLCHLSAENNHPELAYKATEMRLAERGVQVGRDVQLEVLKRNTPSQLFELE